MKRVVSVDALRGLVMIIMALDHVRDFIHRGAMSQSPTDLATTTPILFLTRWITHFCAPVFMLTAGMGAYWYWIGRNRSRTALSRFLITRGLWLIVLELTLMQFAYNFNLSTANPIFLIVLWVLGASMIVLAALVWLPMSWLAGLSIGTIALHNLLDGVRSTSPWWILLHRVGAFSLAGRTFIAAYSLVPWCAVMVLGFCLGRIFERTSDERRRYLLQTGITMTLAFVVFRAINIYGDPSRWSAQPSPMFTAMSFLNTTKYPPSLLFLLMTLGPALILLAQFDRQPFARQNPLIVFGRVPLFYFVLHFFAAHFAIVALAFATFGTAASAFMFQPVPSMGGPARSFPHAFGYDLWVAYAVWIAIVIALYPVCRWFAGVKERNRSWWMSYL